MVCQSLLQSVKLSYSIGLINLGLVFMSMFLSQLVASLQGFLSESVSFVVDGACFTRYLPILELLFHHIGEESPEGFILSIFDALFKLTIVLIFHRYRL